jgi:hypothetical protein
VTNDRPDLSSERAPRMDRKVNFKQEETSGHELQPGFDTKTDRPIDRQSQCDFDLSCQVSEFCTRGFEDRAWAREAEEFLLLEAVARERLVKTQQAVKSLSVCCDDLWIVEIGGGAVITCTSESCV